MQSGVVLVVIRRRDARVMRRRNLGLQRIHDTLSRVVLGYTHSRGILVHSLHIALKHHAGKAREFDGHRYLIPHYTSSVRSLTSFMSSGLIPRPPFARNSKFLLPQSTPN